MKLGPFDFRDIRLLEDTALCVKFKSDALVVSFGSAEMLPSTSQGEVRYLESLGKRFSNLPGSCVHVWAGSEIAEQIEVRRQPDRNDEAYVSL